VQKTGTLRYFENLHSGGNRADMEIPALDIKQADGTDPIQNWHQDAGGDISSPLRTIPSASTTAT